MSGIKFNIWLLVFCVFSIVSCEEEDVIVEGMAPVYVSSTDFSMVYSTDTIPFRDLGNIVLSGKYLFINERYEGIHVIDNSDPFKPVKAHFWKIPGNLEFIINGKTLYADNSVHLLVIDITDFSNIKVVNFIKDLYIESPLREPRPVGYKGMFQCVDKKNGIHIGWEKKLLINPLCEAY
jgi:hypothetical protein